MAEITHVQYDELPLRTFTLPFQINGVDVPIAQWPPLNATDKVSMVLKQGVTDRAVKLTITDQPGRKVEWRPAAPENATTGSFEFRVRVTQADGKSYSCPGPDEAPWKLTVKASTAATDVIDAP